MKMKISSIIALLGLCLAGTLSANTLPIHIDPFNQSEYDEIVWGCRLSRCIHVSMERSQRYGGAKEKALIKTYENWLETSGRKLIEDWRAGKPISEKDAKYLPLAKTEYWDALIKDYDKSRYYYHDKKFPDLSKFPEEERTLHEEYQALIEAGEAVLRKIYNQEPLTGEDKAAFHEWVLASYSCYYTGGVCPLQISADSRSTFNKKMQAGDEIQQGDIFPNVAMYKPEYFWSSPEFDEEKYSDVSIHLRAAKTSEMLDRYIAYAQYWEPAENYPQVRPKCPPADAPDTDEYRTLYNFLKEEGKPTLFGTWTINNDEGQVRMVPRLHFLHRALRNKVGFAIAEGSVNYLTEKNDLRFDPSENEQYRTHLLRCFNAPFMPTSYASPVAHFFTPPHGLNTGWSLRAVLMNSSAEFLGMYKVMAQNGDFGGHLCGVLGLEKRLLEGFKTADGFDPDPDGGNLIKHVKMNSVVPGRMAQCAANGYDIKDYTRYRSHIDAIGEIIAVDADKHTVTLLREEYHEEEYPTLALKERFPLTFNEYKTRDHRSGITLGHWSDLAARKKAGNSKSARTLTFKVNVGVGIFLNGDEQADETCLKVGDVASIVYLDDKGGYPHFIRAIRFNFPPTFGEVANTGAGTAELRGIDDDNLIVDQEITVTAKSSSPSKMPDPIVAYKKGVCTFTYTPPPAGETVDVKVTLKDGGGTEFGGNDATKLTLKFTADGAALVD